MREIDPPEISLIYSREIDTPTVGISLSLVTYLSPFGMLRMRSNDRDTLDISRPASLLTTFSRPAPSIQKPISKKSERRLPDLSRNTQEDAKEPRESIFPPQLRVAYGHDHHRHPTRPKIGRGQPAASGPAPSGNMEQNAPF